MLTCKDASELLSQAQDRPLGLRERLVLKLHLLICHGCSNFSRQLDLICATLRRIRDDD
ncbi:MAG: zf-HC2 domain-containing protein [Betaproteobacteria bacterium]|nr:zf-HC2 domain-containing protein [Betaproteobacteria bacterium]